MDDRVVGALRQLVERKAGEFEPGALNLLTAEKAVAEWAAIERVACAAKLRAAARAEEIGLDAEQAVANASGVTAGQARRQTKLASKLKGKAQTADAFNKGEVSVTEANAIADAVDVAPHAEAALLEFAARNSSASDLLNECERVKRDAMDADGTLAARQRAARSVRTWNDGMGMACGTWKLEPVAGAKWNAELERLADRMFRAQVQAKGGVDTQEQRMADALVEVLDSADSKGSAKRRGPRTMVQLLVTKAAVERGYLEPGEKCETAAGKPIPMGAVDVALLDPDTKVQEVVFNEVDVQSIISHKRYRPARLRDALAARGLVCAVTGCGRTKGLEADHTDDFAKGGPTCAANLKWHCHYHHDLKTRGLYTWIKDENGIDQWVHAPRSARE